MESAGKEMKAAVGNKVKGKVITFFLHRGYGFIRRCDTNEDIFVHYTSLTKRNPNNREGAVMSGEEVEFDVITGKKGDAAVNVTGPNGENLKGSRCRVREYSNRRGRGGFRNNSENKDGKELGDNDESVAETQRGGGDSRGGSRGRFVRRFWGARGGFPRVRTESQKPAEGDKVKVEVEAPKSEGEGGGVKRDEGRRGRRGRRGIVPRGRTTSQGQKSDRDKDVDIKNEGGGGDSRGRGRGRGGSRGYTRRFRAGPRGGGGGDGPATNGDAAPTASQS